MFKIVDFICSNPDCNCEIEGFEGDKEICPKCKCEMAESTMQNHAVKGVRGYRFRDTIK